MNFMPSEDAFFDEPLHNAPQAPLPVDHSGELLESSIRQEKLLERLIHEMERMNRNLIELRLAREHSNASPAPSPSSSNVKPTAPASGPAPPRGNLILPPGSRPVSVPNVPEKKPGLSEAEEAAAREKDERDAILRRRAEEEARIARIEAERLEREAEEERKRIAELKRIEDEKRMKEELERKTRGLMSGLLTSDPTGLFGDDDVELPGKKKGGLFDD
jgi:hypothetical protein